MARARNSVVIRRPIGDVFAVITNVENLGRWFPGDVEERWTSPPPHGVGSTRHATVRMFGRTTENDAVTTEYDPPHRAAIRGTTPNAPFHVGLDFGETDDGTRVDVTSEFNMGGAGALVAPLGVWVYGRMWARGLRNLKRMMESGEL